MNLEEIKKSLYIVNEYGVSYQNPNARLTVEQIDWLEKKYNIKTKNMRRSCINCQARQIIKYANSKDKNGNPIEGFKVSCKGSPKNLPLGSSEALRVMIEQQGMDPKRAELLLSAPIDPVAWASLVFGFNDGDVTFNLRSYQKEQLRCTSKKIVLREGRRSGKALPLDTPIPTPNGFSTMGELKIGDYVFGTDGKPTQIIYTSDIMENHEIYKLTFDDGTSIDADLYHQWTLSSDESRKQGRKKNIEAQYTCTTKDILDIGIHKGKFRILMPEAVEYSTKEQSLHPYLLGCWLAGGNINNDEIIFNPRIRKTIINKIKDTGNIVKEMPNQSMSIAIPYLKSKIRNLNIKYFKYIPTNYLETSLEQRYILLQGLIDIAGRSIKNGFYTLKIPEFTLVENIKELLCSLGIKNRVRQKADIYEISFVLKELAVNVIAATKELYREIIDIKKVESVPVKCIMVDSENSLYLAGRQYLPTHNTFIIAVKLLHAAFNNTVQRGTDLNTGEPIVTGPEIMIVTPFQAQLLNIFNEMEKLLKRNKDLMNHCLNRTGGSLYTKTPFFHFDFDNGATINGFVSGVANKADGSGGGTMRGYNATILYLDEMDMIPEDILNKVVIPILLTETQGNFTLIATSTPIGKRGKFYEWCMQDPSFKEDHLPSTVLPQWERNKAMFENEGSEEDFKKEYMALFIDGANGVFKPSYVYGCMKDYTYADAAKPTWLHKYAGIPEPDKMVKCIGIDWNKNAGTEFVVVGYDPFSHKFIILETINIAATEFSAQRWKEEVVRLNYKWRPDYIYADNGYGHTIIEDLKVFSAQKSFSVKKTAKDVETAKLKDRLIAFDFSQNVEMHSPIDGETITKTGKDFLVEYAVRVLEDGILWMPESEDVLRRQMLNYAILRRNPTTNKPVYGAESNRVGDHRLDALMLALAGIQLELGIYSGKGGLLSSPKFLPKQFLDNRHNSEENDSPAEHILKMITKQTTSFPGAITLLQTSREGETQAEAVSRRAQEVNQQNSRIQFRNRGRMKKEQTVAEYFNERVKDYRGYDTDSENKFKKDVKSFHIISKRKDRGAPRSRRHR